MAKKQKQVEQPQARPLTEIEKNWIKEHYVKDKLTLEDLNRQLPGVDLNEVAAYVNTVYQPPKPGQPIQDRQSQLANMPAAGQFMGRDPARGVAVMTEAASEISDARKVVAVPSNDSLVRSQPDKIHIINPNKRAR